MILRILVLALFFTACTSDAATEQDAATETTTPAANQQQQQVPSTSGNSTEAQAQQKTDNKPGVIETKNLVLESSEEVATQIMTNFSRIITLRADQKEAMMELVSQYPIDELEDKGKARTELRNKILTEIFDKEQIEIWKQYQRKRNLEPVTIE